jgi:hypothetical protein
MSNYLWLCGVEEETSQDEAPTEQAPAIDAGTFEQPEVSSTALARDEKGKFARKDADQQEHQELTRIYSQSVQGTIQKIVTAPEAALDEPSDSVIEAASKRLLKNVLESNSESSPAAKNFEAVLKASGLDTKPAIQHFEIKTVVIHAPSLPEGVGHEHYQKPTKPSAQFFKDNHLTEPDYIEAEVVSTDAPKPSVPIPAASQTAIDAEALSKSGGLYVSTKRP